MRPSAEYANLLEFKGDANKFLPEKRWIKTSLHGEINVLLSINI